MWCPRNGGIGWRRRILPQGLGTLCAEVRFKRIFVSAVWRGADERGPTPIAELPVAYVPLPTVGTGHWLRPLLQRGDVRRIVEIEQRLNSHF